MLLHFSDSTGLPWCPITVNTFRLLALHYAVQQTVLKCYDPLVISDISRCGAFFFFWCLCLELTFFICFHDIKSGTNPMVSSLLTINLATQTSPILSSIAPNIEHSCFWSWFPFRQAWDNLYFLCFELHYS